MLLTDDEIKRIGEGNTGSWQDDLQFARAIESAVLAKLKAQEPALVRYNKHMAGESEPDPVERLRFFLSLALTGQNWLDVEKFLDDLPPDDVVRDADRLDWLEKNLTGASDSERYLPFRVYWGDGRGIRKAIDAAMKGMK